MENKIWILSNPRCGTRYVCYFLGFFLRKRFGEEFNPNPLFPETFYNRNDIDSISNKRKFILNNENLPGHMRLFYLHYDNLKLKNKDLLFLDQKNNIKFIFIKRRDILKQAISHYLANLTNDWYIGKEKKILHRYISKLNLLNIQYNKKLHNIIKRHIKCIKYFNQKWEEIISYHGDKSKFLYIEYENVIKYPIPELTKILNFCGQKVDKELIKKAITNQPLQMRSNASDYLERHYKENNYENEYQSMFKKL